MSWLLVVAFRWQFWGFGAPFRCCSVILEVFFSVAMMITPKLGKTASQWTNMFDDIPCKASDQCKLFSFKVFALQILFSAAISACESGSQWQQAVEVFRQQQIAGAWPVKPTGVSGRAYRKIPELLERDKGGKQTNKQTKQNKNIYFNYSKQNKRNQQTGKESSNNLLFT